MRIRKYLYETKWTEVIVATRELKCKFQYFAADQHLQCQEMTLALSCLVCFLSLFSFQYYSFSLDLFPFFLWKVFFISVLFFFEYSLVLLKMYKSAVESRDFVIWVVFFVEFNLCGIFIYSQIFSEHLPHANRTHVEVHPKSGRKCQRPHCIAWSDLAMVWLTYRNPNLHLYVPFSQAQMICQIMLSVADSFLIM